MSRRPLGASLRLEPRLEAYERWIREIQAAVHSMGLAREVFDTGLGQDGRRVSAGRAWDRLEHAMTGVQEAAEGQIGHKKGRKPRSETVPST